MFVIKFADYDRQEAAAATTAAACGVHVRRDQATSTCTLLCLPLSIRTGARAQNQNVYNPGSLKCVEPIIQILKARAYNTNRIDDSRIWMSETRICINFINSVPQNAYFSYLAYPCLFSVQVHVSTLEISFPLLCVCLNLCASKLSHHSHTPHILLVPAIYVFGVCASVYFRFRNLLSDNTGTARTSPPPTLSFIFPGVLVCVKIYANLRVLSRGSPKSRPPMQAVESCSWASSGASGTRQLGWLSPIWWGEDT